MKITSGEESKSLKILDDDGKDITSILRCRSVKIEISGRSTLVAVTLECNVDAVDIDIPGVKN